MPFTMLAIANYLGPGFDWSNLIEGILSSLIAFSSCGLFSLISNYLLLKTIDLNIFGPNIKNLVHDLFKSKIYGFIYFLFIFILIFSIKNNMLSPIYLDTVNINLKISGFEIAMSGEALSTALSSFGEAGVFLGCANLAHLIIASKKGLAIPNKIGIVIGGGASGLTTFKVIDKGFKILNSDTAPIIFKGTLKLDSVTLSTNASYPIPEHPILSYVFGMHKDIKFTNLNQPYQIIRNPQLNTTTIQSINSDNSIIDTLNKTNPNWKGQFHDHIIINSPYESESEFVNSLIDILTNNLYLSLISIYLLTMLIIIFICKLILSSNIELKFLSDKKIFNYSLGEKIVNLINLYIRMWQKTSSFWIFFIIVVVIFSLVGISFSTWSILTVLKNIT